MQVFIYYSVFMFPYSFKQFLIKNRLLCTHFCNKCKLSLTIGTTKFEQNLAGAHT